MRFVPQVRDQLWRDAVPRDHSKAGLLECFGKPSQDKWLQKTGCVFFLSLTKCEGVSVCLTRNLQEFRESSLLTLPVEWSHVFTDVFFSTYFGQPQPSPSGDETLLVLRSVVQG